MTISTQFDNQWNQLADPVLGSGTIHISTIDGDLQCVVTEVSLLAAKVDKLTLFSERLGGASTEKLEAIGREICDRVTYLMEPLALIEIDGETRAVQARSAPPQQDDQVVRYFEVSASAERGLSLQRFEAPRKAPRTQIPAAMTREMLERLIDDCLAAVEKAA